MPAPTTSTVACPADAAAPTPPPVNDNCNRPLTISAPVATLSLHGALPISYTFTYTDCAGATYTWTHTTTVLPPTVVMPAPTTSTVACPADASAAERRAVKDSSGRRLTISAQVASSLPACSGDIAYVFRYTDCP